MLMLLFHREISLGVLETCAADGGVAALMESGLLGCPAEDVPWYGQVAQ